MQFYLVALNIVPPNACVENYRNKNFIISYLWLSLFSPLSLDPHGSKAFERTMYMQIDTFMRDKLSKLLTGFRKNHSTQHCLMSMLEMWKNTLDKGGYVSAIFMDLSKAFDTLNHNLLISKLGPYGFERDSLSFIKSYLKDRQQRLRVNNNFSCRSTARFNTRTAFI